MQNRHNALNEWLKQTLHPTPFQMTALTGDASFRQYFRLQTNGLSRVVMDAPPEVETLGAFLSVNKVLQQLGIKTPMVHAQDESQGFVILDDFGDELLLHRLSPITAKQLYPTAMAVIHQMQQCPPAISLSLPSFDNNFMWQELRLFSDWFLKGHLKLDLLPEEENLLKISFTWLINEILEQPQVFIHRDFHSRNIMILQGEDSLQLGILDFQDAMSGPFTYDLVSLLKDCYIQWPDKEIMSWLTSFYEQSQLAQQWSLAAFKRAFILTGLQRHLKILGIFSRLHLRDKKANYLQYLPRTVHYLMSSLEDFEPLRAFFQFMQRKLG